MIRTRGVRFDEIPAERASQLLLVHRSSVYRTGAAPKRPPAWFGKLLDLALELPFYGYRRIAHELKRHGYAVSEKQVRREMAKAGLQVRSRRTRVVTTIPGGGGGPNLAAGFVPDRPNRLWVTDITYIWTHEGLLYLAAMLDVFSRLVVAHTVATSLKGEELTLPCLEQALKARNPEPGWIHHSDRGVHYTSGLYTDLVAWHGGLTSYSRLATPTDNAYAESFFDSFKDEEVWRSEYTTRKDAIASIQRYIEFYNSRRLHSSIGYIPPEEYEMLYTEQKEVISVQ